MPRRTDTPDKPEKPDKRAQILRAAAQCFARFGYAKTTLDDIGRAVKLNKASLYYYFPGKDELFMAVVLAESAEFQRRLAESVQAQPTPADAIRQYLTERLRYYRQVLNLHQLTLENLHSLEPRFDALYAFVLEEEVASLAALLAPYGRPDARRIASILLTAADAIKHQAVRAADVLTTDIDFSTAEVETRLLVELVLAGLAAPHPRVP